MQPRGGVLDEGTQLLGVSQVFLGHLIGHERLVIGQHGGQKPVLVLDDSRQAVAKRRRVEQVSHPHAVHTANLVSIARTDPAPGRSEMIGRGRRFLGQTLLGEVIR